MSEKQDLFSMLLLFVQQYRELYAVQKKQWEREYDAFLKELPNKDEYLKQLKAQRGLVLAGLYLNYLGSLLLSTLSIVTCFLGSIS